MRAAHDADTLALDLYAVCAPGLESFAAAELHTLGITPNASEPGGVSFTGTHDALYRANLELRTVSRVIARLAEFRARAFGELERRASAAPWERFLDPARPVRVRVTCRKSRLYHSDGVAERVASAIDARLGGGGATAVGASTARSAPVDTAGSDENEPEDAQLVIVRLFHDRCTISIDSSGALLHRRGYRQETAKAPLRETLAAALLAASGWDARSPLLDPFCGSGTIAIEGALIARRIAPGLGRRFAFMHWPDFDAARWSRVCDAARDGALPAAAAPIQGSDRDAGAVRAASANAERAGVASDIELTTRSVSAIDPPAAAGWLVTNPPYGVRVGDARRIRDLYAQLGHVVRARCAGWVVTLLAAEPRLVAQLAMPFALVLQSTNGGIPVRGVRAVVPTVGHSARAVVPAEVQA